MLRIAGCTPQKSYALYRMKQTTPRGAIDGALFILHHWQVPPEYA